jgi:hypothetical protein
MAALVLVFRSGDCLTWGTTSENAKSAYDLLLNAATDLVSLEGFELFPRFAIRKSEIAQVWLDPNDTTTIVASTALTGLQAAFGLRDLCFAVLRGLQANAKPNAGEPGGSEVRPSPLDSASQKDKQ